MRPFPNVVSPATVARRLSLRAPVRTSAADAVPLLTSSVTGLCGGCKYPLIWAAQSQVPQQLRNLLTSVSIATPVAE